MNNVDEHSLIMGDSDYFKFNFESEKEEKEHYKEQLAIFDHNQKIMEEDIIFNNEKEKEEYYKKVQIIRQNYLEKINN